MCLCVRLSAYAETRPCVSVCGCVSMSMCGCMCVCLRVCMRMSVNIDVIYAEARRITIPIPTMFLTKSNSNSSEKITPNFFMGNMKFLKTHQLEHVQLLGVLCFKANMSMNGKHRGSVMSFAHEPLPLAFVWLIQCLTLLHFLRLRTRACNCCTTMLSRRSWREAGR